MSSLNKLLYITSCIILMLNLSTTDIQAQICTGGAPYHVIDLTGNPDSVWIGPSESRDGSCCGSKKNETCVEFLVTLDPGAEGINLFVASGAKPSGALGWKLNCGTEYPVDVDVCLSGTGPHRITFCKPGNNPNQYGIKSVGKPDVSEPTVAADFCTGTLSVTNFDPATIQWRTMAPGTPGQYNSALSCTSFCDTVIVDYIAGLTYLDVEVSGLPVGGCSAIPVVLTTRVYFVDDKVVTIAPKHPTICFGGTYTQITATGTGGAPPYTYNWSNGATGATINAPSVGWYVVTMSDTTGCPPVKDSVYVTAYASAITADAGPEDTSCANNPDLILQGSIVTATQAVWSGGAGTYNPNPNTLNATYTPTPAEITAGSVTHTLTTLDNGTCPPSTDQVIQYIVPTPIVNAGSDATICATGTAAALNGSFSNAGGVIWSGGTGTYFPNNTSAVTSYRPSAAEITAGSVTLTLTSTGNGTCLPVTDQVLITITNAPTINAGLDQTVCGNNATVNLNATFTVATGVVWSGGSGTFGNINNAITTYTPSAAEITAGSVTLTATTTGIGNCAPVSDNILINITPAPTANAGIDRTICANNTSLSLNGIVTVATGGQWSGGTGTFSPDNQTLNATYTPSITEINNGFVDLTLSTTGIGNCLAVTDVMRINITPAPIVNAGVDRTVCGNNATLTLNGSVTINSIAGTGQWIGGAGTFSPSRNALNASYIPTATEISNGSVSLTLQSTNNNLCTAVSDVMNITITPAPTVNAGPAQTVCANAPNVTLNGSFTVAGGVQWSGGTGTYSSGSTSAVTNYIPSAAEISAGVVNLTLTTTGNGTCNAVSSNTTITITPAPVVNAGNDITVCGNNPTLNLNGSVTVTGTGQWSGGSGTFNPGNTTLNASYTPSASEITAGGLVLTLTSTNNGNCSPVTDMVNITITPAPTVNAGIDQTVCGNNASTTLNGSITVATGGQWTGGTGTFSPSATALNAIYTPSATEISNGSVSLTLTTTGNGSCIAVTDVMTISITPAPVVNAGTDQIICANNPVVNLTGSVTVTGTGTWSGGSGTFGNSNALTTTYTPSASEISAGIATLRLTSTNNGNCNPVFDEINISITPAPTVNAGADRTVCGNNANLVLNGSVTIATGGTWSGGTGTFSPNNNTLNATYTPSAAEISAGTANLTLTTTGIGTCNAVSDNLVITITPAPTINAGPDQTACSNNPAVSLTSTVSVATGGTWSGGTGFFNPGNNLLTTSYTPSATEITNGSVILTISSTGNGNCNPVSDQILINYTPAPIIDAGNPITVCSNNSVINLNGSVTGATGGTWTGGAGSYSNANSLTSSYTPTPGEILSGSVTLTLTSTGNGNCIPVSDQVTATFTPSPTVNAGIDETTCENNALVTLNGTITIATGGTWSGGSGTFSDANSLTTTYIPSAAEISAGQANLTLTTTGNGNCNPVSDNIRIAVTPGPTADAGPDQFVCGNNPSFTLNGSVTLATGGRWIGSGGTFAPDENSLITVYSPSAFEVSSTLTSLILESTGNGKCLPAYDTVIVFFQPAPIPNAGPDQNICSNNPSVVLSGSAQNASANTWSGGSGTFSPSNTSLNAVYIPTTAEITAGQVNIILTSTRTGCLPVTDNMTVNFTPSPVVNAGPDQSSCSNNPIVQLNAIVSIATGVTWSGGNGTFSNFNGLTTNYTPTATEINTGSVTLTATSTGNGNCNAVTDNMVITYTPSPTANAGLDQTVCFNNPTITLNGSVTIATGGTWTGGTGVFTPNNNTLNATYEPSLAEKNNGFVDLTLTTTGNGSCLPVTDLIRINITPAPVVNAGPDFTICTNNPIATLQGQVTGATGVNWTGGNGTYNPNSGTLNATYSPSSAELTTGNFTLTLTSTGNGNCNPVTDMVNVTITPAPTINAGPDIAVCGNVSTVPLNGTVTTATGGTWSSGGTGTFSPNANTLNAQYVPSVADKAAGNIVLTLTTTGNGNCNALTDALVITFTPIPDADAGLDQTVCSNDFPVQLNGSGTTSSWNGGTGTFAPNRNVLNPTYVPSPAEISQGFVDLTLTTIVNGACSAISDVVRITIPQGPITDAGSDRIVCGDIAQVSLNGLVQNAGGGIWTTNGSGSFDPNPISLNTNYLPHNNDINAGPIRFILTSTGNGVCSAENDTMFVTFTNPPVVTAGSDRTICADQSSISLTGVVTVATGGTWTTSGTGTFANPNALNTTYNFSAQDITNGNVQLTLTSTGNGTCNPVSNTITITITPAPTANAGPDVSICADSSSVNLSGTVTVATGGIWSTTGTGTFSPNNTTLSTSYFPTAADTANGSVQFTLTTTGNGTCNAVTDVVTVNITPTPIINAGPDQTFCADNKTINLAGTVLHATGGSWTSNGSGTFGNPNNLATTYTLSSADSASGAVTLRITSTGNGTCKAVSDQIFLILTPAPIANAGPDMVVCGNNAGVSLSGSVTNAGGGIWSGGAGTFSPDATSLNAVYQPTAAEIAAGTVTLTLTTTNVGTCIPVADQINITITPIPVVTTNNNTSVCGDISTFPLTGQVTVANGGIWTTSGTGFFTPSATDLNAQYIPSTTDTANGSVTLTLTSTGNGTCLAVSEAFTLDISPAPIVNAGNNITVCGNNADIQLNGVVTTATGGIWTSSGSGTFAPNANTLDAIYTPSAAEIAAGAASLTLTSSGNGTCIAKTDQVLITITPAPVVNAGDDLDVCANNPSIVLNGSVTIATGGIWSGGSGIFNPNDNSLNTQYVLSAAEIAAGFVDLTLTSTGNGQCNPVSNIVRLNVLPAPVANAGSDITICGDVNSVNLNGIVTGAIGGLWSSDGSGNFTPNANTLNASYNLSAGDKASGSVRLILTTTNNGSCLEVKDTLDITISPTPTVNAGTDITLCANNAEASLNGAVTIATGGTWSGGAGTFSDNNALATTYIPTPTEINNGFVILTLTSTGNGTCNPVSDNIRLSYTPAPVVNAGPDAIVCENNPVTNLGGSVTVATGGIWSGGTGTFNDANNLITQYTLSATEITNGGTTLILTSIGNGNCLAVTDTLLITTSPSPVVNAGTDLSICADQTSVALGGSVTIASGGIWSTDGTGTFSPNANTLTADYLPSAADTANGTVLLTLTSEGNGSCLAESNQITLTIIPKPIVSAGTNQTVCADIGSINLNGTSFGATGGTWSGGTGVFADANNLVTTYTPSQAEITNGTVTLELTSTGNGLCNAVSNFVTYTITPAPTSNAGPDQNICADKGSITLNGNVTIATGGIWSSSGSGTFTPGNGTLNASYNFTSQDTTNKSVELYLTTTGNGTCNPVVDTMRVTINPVPIVNAGADRTICADVSTINLNDASVLNTSGGIWTSTGTGVFSPSANAVNATYTPSAIDQSTGNILLTLTSTGMGSCNAVSDQVNIIITPRPTANAGINDTVCVSTGPIQLNGIVSVATGGIWSTGSGLGTFSPSANSLNATFTPDQAQLNSGIATLILTTTGNGTCNPVTSRKFIIFRPLPIIDAGPNQTICSDLASLPLNGSVSNAGGITWTTSGTGTFNNVDILNPIYTPSALDKIAGQIILRARSTGNIYCQAVTDSLVLRINPIPTVNAGPATLCANAGAVTLNGSITNAGGGAWTTTGTGTFAPTNTILSPTYNPSAADISTGLVQLILTTTGNGPCAARRDTILLNITPLPVANAGLDRIVCANAGAVTLSGIVVGATGGTWTSSGAGSFSPDANTLNAQYTPSAADIVNGSATLTLTTTGVGLCTPATDQIVITVTPAPTVNPGLPITVCADTAGIQLNGAVTIATGVTWSSASGGTFSPNNNILNPVYIPSASDISNGTATLTITSTGNGGCIAVSRNVTMTITPTPTIDIGPDFSICGDINSFALAGNVTVASGRRWTTLGNGTFTPDSSSRFVSYNLASQDTANGSVTIIGTTTGNGTCKPVSDTATITISPAPYIFATAESVCADKDTIQLSGQVFNAGGAGWTTSGDGIFLPDTSTLNARYVTSINDKANGQVTLVLHSVLNGLCNEVSDTILLNISPPPSANAGNDTLICAANTGLVLNGAVQNATGGIWSTMGTGSFNNPSVLNTTYFASATDTTAGFVNLVLTTTGTGSCQAVTDTMVVTFTPAPIVNAGPGIVCSNVGIVDLSGQFANAGGLLWSTSGVGTFTPSTTDLNVTYTFTGQDLTDGFVNIYLESTTNGICAAARDTVLINMASAPVATATGPASVCANNSSISLSGSALNAGGMQWSTLGSGTFNNANISNPVYTPSNADTANGSVSIILSTTLNGACAPETDTLVIDILPAPIVDAGPASVCSNNTSLNLSGTVYHATGGIWSTLGDGTFADPNDLITSFTPGANDISNAQATLVLTSTGIGTCNPVSDTMILYITPPPTPTAGGPAAVCADAGTIILNGSVIGSTGGIWTTNGSGSFNDPTDLSATYTLTNADTLAGSVEFILSTTGNGNCNATSDTLEVLINPAPIVNAGNNQTVCNNTGSVVLNGTISNATGGIWSSSGTGGTFTPGNTDLNASYIPSESDTTNGSVILTLTTTGNGTCNTYTDALTVTFQDIPVIDAGPSSICATDRNIALDATVLNATGATWTTISDGTFAPNANTVDAIYLTSDNDTTNGSVTLTVTTTGNGACAASQDQITINITTPPSANAFAVAAIQCADGTIDLSGTFSGATGILWTTSGSGTWNPNDGTLNTSYIPSTAEATTTTELTLYFALTTTGTAPCAPVSDTISVTLTPAPIAIVNAGNDTTVCEGISSIPLQGTISVASGAEWTTTGNGIFSPDAFSLNTIYIPDANDLLLGSIDIALTTTGNGLCNPISDTMTVSFLPKPIVDAGADESVCEDVPNIILNGSITNAGGGIWTSSGSGSFNDNTLINATYSISTGDISDSIVVLTLTSTGNPACADVFDTKTLYIKSAPELNAGLDQEVCGDNRNIQLAGSILFADSVIWSGNGTGTFTPDVNDLNAVYAVSDADTLAGQVEIYLTIPAKGGCLEYRDTVLVTITDSPEINLASALTVCADTAGIILSPNAAAIENGSWTSSGSGTFAPDANTVNVIYIPSVADTAAGIITLTFTSGGDNGCSVVSGDIDITINPIPVVYAGPDQTVCGNNSLIFLNGQITNATGGIWSGGNGTYSTSNTDLNAVYTPSASEIQAGIVNLTLTSTGMGTCKPVRDQVSINITPAPTVNAGPDQVICANNPLIQLAGNVTVSGGGVWSFGGGTFTPGANTLTATYEPTIAEIVARQTRLVLTSTSNGNCLAVTDTLDITFTDSTVATAGSDQTICHDNFSINLSGGVAFANSGSWSSSGSGIFLPTADNLNTQYVPSLSDKDAGSISLVLTTTGNGNCVAATDTVLLTITPDPTITAGPDISVCSNNPEINLSAAVTISTGVAWTGGTGTFVPNTSDLNITYTPTPAEIAAGYMELTITSTGNGQCSPVSDIIGITFTPSPVVDAGPDQIVCANNSLVSLSGSTTVASGVTWSNGTGTFNPDSNNGSVIYNPSNAEITAGNAQLVLTSTGNGNCLAVTDTIEIDITPAPTANAGLDITVCADTSLISLNGLVTTAISGEWTSTGSGTFNPSANQLNPGYKPSNLDIAAGTVKFYLTTTGNGNCLAVKDSLDLIITPAPSINAGIDRTVCANNNAVSLSGSVSVSTGVLWTGGGTFTASATDLNPVYTPSATENANGFASLTITSNGNGQCKAVSDVVNITITPSPLANAGPDMTVCFNNEEVQLNGSVQVATGGIWSNGTGSYNPSETNLNASYMPGNDEKVLGSATLILTTTGNGDCLAETDDVLINISPAPVVSAGNNQTLCADVDNISLNGSVTIASGGRWTVNGTGVFTPSEFALNAVYIPSASDRLLNQLTFTLTSEGNGNCIPVSDNMDVILTPAPTILAANDFEVCADANSVTISATVTVANNAAWTSSGDGSFNTSPFGLTTEYIISNNDRAAGQVLFNVTSFNQGTCKAVSDQMLLTITQAPFINAGINQTICADASTISLQGSVTVAGGISWTTNGSGTFNNSLSFNPVYNVTPADTAIGSVTFYSTSTDNGLCLAKTDTVLYTINPVPIVSAGGGRICSDVTGLTLNGKVLHANSMVWSTSGSGSFSPNPNLGQAKYTPSQSDIAAGLVILTLTSEDHGTCNPVSKDIQVIITPLPEANAGDDRIICRGSSITLNAKPISDVTYAWYTENAVNISDASSIFITTSRDTSFVFSVTDDKGCSVYDTINVAVTDPPTFNLPAHFCFNQGVAMNSNPSFIPAEGGFQWFRNDTLLYGETNTSYLIENTGKHVVEYALDRCRVYDTTDVTPLPNGNGEDALICINTQGVIHTTSYPGASYQWNNQFGIPMGTNADSLLVTGNAPAIYIVFITDNKGCRGSDEIFVDVTLQPLFDIEDQEGCIGETIVLNGKPNNIDNQLSRYQWISGGETVGTSADLPVTTDGTYNLKYTLGLCKAEASASVLFNPLPVSDNSDTTKFCLESDGEITLDAGPATKWEWEPKIQKNPASSSDQNTYFNQTYNTSTPGYHYVKIFNQYNCSIIDSIFAKDVCPPRFFVPDAFVPNGNQFEEDKRFKVFGAYFAGFSITIFNRWGEIIYYSEDQDEGWDGTYRGEPMPGGVYPYIIRYGAEYAEFDEGTKMLEGRVVLIR